MGSKVDNIIKHFPVKVLSPITGELDYELINKIVLKMYGNIDTLTTTTGEVGHGQIRLIMNPILYVMIVQTVYVEPANPWKVLKIPGITTAEESAKKSDKHTVEGNIYRNHVNMDTALKTLINAVEHWFLADKHNQYMGA